MLRKYPAFQDDQSATLEPTFVMILGFGDIGENLIIQLARDWYEHHKISQPKLSIAVYDQYAKIRGDVVQRHFPRLSEACDLIAVDVDLNDEAALEKSITQQTINAKHPDIAYICLNDHSLGFQTALQLRRLLTSIIVSMPEDSGLATILQQAAGTASSQRNIHPFDFLKHSCNPDLVLRGSHELMARAVHENYLQQRLEDGEELGQRRALVPWDSLPEDLRESNRRQVDLIRIKLDRAGYAIIPLVDWDAHSYSFIEAQIELMARLEHQYWVDERESAGWKYAPSPEDLVKKTHPDLLPWEELSEGSKDKDRQAVINLPKVLARAGFQVVRIK
jgi:hypothetical protein